MQSRPTKLTRTPDISHIQEVSDMKVKRCTRRQLDDFCANAGLTDRQKHIVKRRLFDGDNPMVIKICDELCISPTTYHREVKEIKKLLRQYLSDGTLAKL